MKQIAITTENIFAGEADALNMLFGAGLELLHIRKPRSAYSELGELLKDIDNKYYKRIVMHDHFGLVSVLNLKGFHLNGRNPEAPKGSAGLSVSRSCHSLEEVVDAGNCDYVFLSPVFDSISKAGYTRGFTPEQLECARDEGIINERVIALGGINGEAIPLVREYGFGGIAVLGALWGGPVWDGNKETLMGRYKYLQEMIDRV